jgi:hypothetical protein
MVKKLMVGLVIFPLIQKLFAQKNMNQFVLVIIWFMGMPVRQKKLEIYLGNQLKRIVEKNVIIKLII